MGQTFGQVLSHTSVHVFTMALCCSSPIYQMKKLRHRKLKGLPMPSSW